MKNFKITKFFKGGSSTYYASMPQNMKMSRYGWEEQLREWGENTDGGKNYGYNIVAKRCKSIPCTERVKKWQTLRFGPEHLVRAKVKPSHRTSFVGGYVTCSCGWRSEALCHNLAQVLRVADAHKSEMKRLK